MPQNAFDQRIARVYDATSADRFDPAVLAPTVAFLVEQARGGDAWELGVGTGRVALPLSAQGVPVHGIDISESMLAEFAASPTHLGVDDFDVVRQIQVSHHYYVIDGQFEQFSSTHRYVWPAELDLMARIVGMHLIERWADWDRSPFTADSDHHVSVWEKPE